MVLKQPTILVVDDEEDILELLEYNLTKEGFRVVKVASGEDALEAARKGTPDLVVLDLASTPAIAQRVARAETIWEAVFPTIMMGDDRAIAAVYVAGHRQEAGDEGSGHSRPIHPLVSDSLGL